jgi:hypothetical protein
VAVRPHARVFKPKQRVHTTAEKIRFVFALQEISESQDRFLHGLLEPYWRPERRVGFDLHNVQLKLLSKREMRLLDEVDDASVKIFHDLVNDRHGTQFIIDQREFMFRA